MIAFENGWIPRPPNIEVIIGDLRFITDELMQLEVTAAIYVNEMCELREQEPRQNEDIGAQQNMHKQQNKTYTTNNKHKHQRHDTETP